MITPAQQVGALSYTSKGGKFNSLSGHKPRLWIWSIFSAVYLFLTTFNSFVYCWGWGKGRNLLVAPVLGHYFKGKVFLTHLLKWFSSLWWTGEPHKASPTLSHQSHFLISIPTCPAVSYCPWTGPAHSTIGRSTCCPRTFSLLIAVPLFLRSPHKCLFLRKSFSTHVTQ